MTEGYFAFFHPTRNQVTEDPRKVWLQLVPHIRQTETGRWHFTISDRQGHVLCRSPNKGWETREACQNVVDRLLPKDRRP